MKTILRKVITGKLVAVVIMVLSTVSFFTACTKTAENSTSKAVVSINVDTQKITLPKAIRAFGTIHHNADANPGPSDNWYIRFGNNENGLPINLPLSYRREGMAVDVTYTLLKEDGGLEVAAMKRKSFLIKILLISPVKIRIPVDTLELPEPVF